MNKVKLALIGLGKMGLSHLSIAGAHTGVEVVGACDTSAMVIDFLKKFTPFPCFDNYKKMIAEAKPAAVIVAVPTKYHFEIIEYLLQQKIHVFCEKPFTLSHAESEQLTALAAANNLVNQVGYHNRFLGTFIEMSRLIKAGVLQELHHFTAESYGPVVTKPQQDTWRSNANEGGGCLYDYASHVIDLVNNSVGNISNVSGCLLKKIYSKNVEDAVYSLVQLESGLTGVIMVNWSDSTYRKMTTQITIEGANGKIIADATELKLFLKAPVKNEKFTAGWNIQSVGSLQSPVDFYLRGEEYSAQFNYFIAAVKGLEPNTINTFAQATYTDKAIQLMKQFN